MREFLFVALLCALFAPAICCAAGGGESKEPKTRLVVLTDISTLTADWGEADDTESLIRLLLYSNELDIEGLLATQTGRDLIVNPQYIEHVVRKYGEVRENLLKHEEGYPSEGDLLGVAKAGLRGSEETGPDKNSDASDWIISVVDKPDPRPVWFTIWGGPRELAQALYKVSQSRTAAEAARFRSKIRVYAIGDQDPTGKWIKTTYPDVFYITPYRAYRGMYRDGDTSLVTRKWVDTNVVTGHGPLGAAYPNYDGGDPWGAVKGVKEGDTPSLLYLIPNGLGDPEQPTWGSWGGRFSGEGPHYSDARDTVDGTTSERATVYRWRRAYQNSFQARMDWCVTPFDKANHEPVAAVDGSRDRRVRPGQKVALSAAKSIDPDGNKLSYDWLFYSEPSSYKGPLNIKTDGPQAGFTAPEVDSPQTIHIVLTVTDDGSPPLSSYRRIVVTVDPKA